MDTELAYLSETFDMRQRWVLALFLGFVNFWSNAPKCRLFGGGGVCETF